MECDLDHLLGADKMHRAPGLPGVSPIMLRPFVFCVLAMLAPRPSLVAQVELSATLQGQVVDSVTGKPMEGVLVRIDTGPEVFSDIDGRYRLMGLRPGRHMLALLTADCRVNWGSVLLIPGVATEASFKLAVPIGTEQEVRREEAERRRSFGRLITREEIERFNPRTLVDVIRRYAPRMVSGASGQVGSTTGITQRAPNSLTGVLEPVVVLDGTRMSDAAETINMIRPGEIETLELLPSSSGGWEFGSSGSAGVIRITTRKGVQDLGRSEVEACKVPNFPGLIGS
tara:strand:- start:29 stop:883 length:855 start_codon:yes stop_codon:yes gene_type:complete